ncbi:antitoxin Xre/MbcA/ParS toxin-binding domain-containing protein [Sphingomonas sp. GCM10030256]|uniref:antitoxin Xre/MbcA/ParS toxin-binding domain-containing protein n=1 Tax=Sphingomonas sp. GCM10030256 TaxID=3273427 RepID=UPI00361B6DBC
MASKPQDRVREWARLVYKSDEAVSQYLTRSSAVFGGKAPIEVAKTHKGANWVIEELTDRAFGVPVLPRNRNGKAAAPPKRW